jgi:glycosyltransferase involved in cell wall biosynthesis
MKQVDRLIEILNEIDLDFLFIIVGHGTRQYEKYLFDKAKPLLDKNKIRFEGYKKSDELVKYYNAADIFIHVSKSEAGPVSVMEAMACGLPVFCTDTGNTAEVLKENNSGAVVGIKNYKQWKRKLIEFLNGKPIKALDLDIVKKHYDWKNIAEKLIKIYKEVLYGI